MSGVTGIKRTLKTNTPVTNGRYKMKTTISIEEATRDRLADVGKKRETYDKIINDLLDIYAKEQGE